ncbi:MAG: hypothetical protein L3K03_09080, partial [Thermoplasmata archaeon]|nr:hypothetical protein [Thermoplasmata archaeon]
MRASILAALLVSSAFFALVGGALGQPADPGKAVAVVGPLPSPPLPPMLDLTPANGTVGSTVAASGTGFPNDSAIGFTYAGIPVVAACSTDGNGSFPGTSGTPCTFTVPAAPAGAETVVASSGTTSSQFVVGDDPEFITYDSGKNEEFVSNSLSANVSVYSNSNDTVYAS